MTMDDCSVVILVIGFVSCSSFVVFVFVLREGGKLLFSFCYTNADLPIALHWAGITVTCFDLKLQANGLSKNSHQILVTDWCDVCSHGYSCKISSREILLV